jgi:cytochrome P450
MAFALYEMRIVLATILKRARLELERPAPLKVVLRSFVFAPEGGTRVRVAALDGRTARGRVESRLTAQADAT